MRSSREPDRTRLVGRVDVIRRAIAAGGLVAGGMRAVHGQGGGSDVIRVGLIGAGGRGMGALGEALTVPGSNVRVTAIADAFEGRLRNALKALNDVKDLGSKLDVPEERQFAGLDAWKRVLDAGCDLVILAAPGGFRPYHFQAAIAAGMHVFLEKPLCVDAHGARLCLEAAKQADATGLKVGVGLQRRYENSYRQAVARVREGLIGEILGGQIYWNSGGIWYRNREPGLTEMQFQVNNWYHFNWLSGGHIVEQHVHNIDVANWLLGALPESAYGIGGRNVRPSGQPGEIYDHHAVTFTYPNGARIASQCKMFAGGDSRVAETFQGTKGNLSLRPGHAVITDHEDRIIWKFEGPNPNPYQAEHDELQAAIRGDTPLNDAFHGVTSSFTAVLGRLATQSGQEWRYDDALNLDDRTMPETLAWDAAPPVVPDAAGEYPLAMPATFAFRNPRTQRAKPPSWRAPRGPWWR